MNQRKAFLMCIAHELGLDDDRLNNLINRRWEAWATAEPALWLVPDPTNLPAWVWRTRRKSTTSAEHGEVDAVLRGLACVAAEDGGNDGEAALVLAWLMLPAACSVARRLRGRDPGRIDAIVATQLFILARSFRWRTRRGNVAANITRDLRAEVRRDLGSVDSRVLVIPTDPETLARIAVADDPVEGPDAELARVLEEGFATGAISGQQRALLEEVLTRVRALPVRPRATRTGLNGLLVAEVAQAMAREHHVSTRQVRRQVNQCVAALTRMVHQLEAA